MSELNSAREQAAFAAGIETARQMALTAAVTLGVRDDANKVRQQAAAAALQGLAEGLLALVAEPTSTCIPPVFAGAIAGTKAIGRAYDERVLG